MNNNSPHDESENPSPRQGTFKDRIDAALASIAEDIKLLHEYRCIDELSPDQRARSEKRDLAFQKRLLNLLGKIEKAKAKRQIKSSNDD